MWKSENEQHKKYLEKKKLDKLDNMKRYQEDLRIQTEDKKRREAEMAALSKTLS